MRGARSLRWSGAASAAPLLLVAAQLALPSPAPARPDAARLEQSFLQAINRSRIEHGLPPVRLDRRLRGIARAHSHDMIRRGYFAHRAFARRIARAGAPGNWVGEILGWAAETNTPVHKLVVLWLASPTHRSVLLAGDAARIGVGVARGAFEDHAVAFVVTADFQGWSRR